MITNGVNDSLENVTVVGREPYISGRRCDVDVSLFADIALHLCIATTTFLLYAHSLYSETCHCLCRYTTCMSYDTNNMVKLC